MSDYNLFGADYSGVINLYVGSSPKDFGSEEAIAQAIARNARQVASALTPLVYQQMTEPDLELVVRRGVHGQTTAQLGLIPVVPGSLRLWAVFQGAIIDPANIPRPIPNIAEWSFSLNVTTGALTGITPALNTNDHVYASYQVNTEAAEFAIPSLAETAVYGAAAELGAMVYSQSDQQWALVEQYQKTWESAIAALRNGTFIPDELRKMRWYSEVERSSNTIGSFNLLRG